MENSEFLDIILGALPPSYESVMNALTTSLDEVGKPIEIDSIIRILKAQYDKKKSLSTNQEEQDSWDHQQKRRIHALIASEKDILSRIAGLKEVEKKVKVQSR